VALALAANSGGAGKDDWTSVRVSVIPVSVVTQRCVDVGISHATVGYRVLP
jgi:hypothetical protein